MHVFNLSSVHKKLSTQDWRGKPQVEGQSVYCDSGPCSCSFSLDQDYSGGRPGELSARKQCRGGEEEGGEEEGSEEEGGEEEGGEGGGDAVSGDDDH